MLRTHTCGELRLHDEGKNVKLCGWLQTIRNKGRLVWLDLRDRYGITQLVLEQGITPQSTFEQVKKLAREYVLCVEGSVHSRKDANPKLTTGSIEVVLTALKVLNTSQLPPFLIEDSTDGGSELRMRYRYLDLRRRPLQKNLQLRHRFTKLIRNYLDEKNFIEIDTPSLIKSTPEGARDFVVPVGKGFYYALPQSPQSLKQLLMISGMDRYYQIVKCFRHEDLRADRQPEFTQLDCELSFVDQEDILQLFEGLIKHLFAEAKQVALPKFYRMTYQEAREKYGTDKPDLRWGMPFIDFKQLAQGQDFTPFDQAEIVSGICLKQGARLSRREIDTLVDFVKKPAIGAKGLVYVKYDQAGNITSSVQKWYQKACLAKWLQKANATQGDMLLLLSGQAESTRQALSDLRVHVGKMYCPHLQDTFSPLWVVNFPLVAWHEEEKRYHALHHPFTAPQPGHESMLDKEPDKVVAQAYDLIINGIEIGGGSVRIHDKHLQMKLFRLLGFSDQEAHKQFGFLLEALVYGAPPHAGIALGFDRLCMVLDQGTSIRDYIAFPKNNAGRDLMLNAPSYLPEQELDHLNSDS